MSRLVIVTLGLLVGAVPARADLVSGIAGYWRHLRASPACTSCLRDGLGHAWRPVAPYQPNPEILLQGRGRDLWHPTAPFDFLGRTG